MLYSGIDLHKRTVVIATVDETGRVPSRRNSPLAFEAPASTVPPPRPPSSEQE